MQRTGVAAWVPCVFPRSAFTGSMRERFVSLRTGRGVGAGSCSVCTEKRRSAPCIGTTATTMRVSRNRHTNPKRRRSTATTSSTSATSANTAPSSRNAPRVDTDSCTLSVRAQLKLARAASATELPSRQSQTELRATRYRRPKADTAVLRGNARRNEQDANTPDGKYDIHMQPILYIDGYNVIGFWPRLRKHRNKGDLDMARNLLLRDVVEFAHIRAWSCVLVYDAQGYVGSASDSTNTVVGAAGSTTSSCSSSGEALVRVVYTRNESADCYIERSIFEEIERDQRQVWAATSDHAQGNFSRAKGAHVMSASLFVQELKRARKESRDVIASAACDGDAAAASMLIRNVDPSTKEKLYKLREMLDAR